MPIHQQISEVEGVQDPKVALLLRQIKRILEDMHGENPRKKEIQTINPSAVPAGIYNKLNEIISQLQGKTVSQGPQPATQPDVDSIWFWDSSAQKMTWLTLAGGALQISGTTLDTLNGSGCLRGPGTAS